MNKLLLAAFAAAVLAVPTSLVPTSTASAQRMTCYNIPACQRARDRGDIAGAQRALEANRGQVERNRRKWESQNGGGGFNAWRRSGGN